jgi:hypothetical protein
MTLLNSGVLWGLLALAVPIIVHFFNLQRPRQILFSNVAFVKEVKKSVVRRLKFQQWLLLAARLLAIAALVLAFANPVIVSEDQPLFQGNRSIALVIDNSYSMNAGNEKGVYFQQAISLARNIIKAYGRQDEFLLMTTSDLKFNHNFSDQEEVQEELRTLAISQNIRPYSDLIGLQKEIFSRSSNPLKELYFLSDFQRSTVMADSQEVALNDSSLIFKFIPLATREQNNVYVADTKIESQIVELDKPVEMSMSLVNDGNAQIRDLSVRVMLSGKAAAISNKSLDPNASANLSLSFTPTESGWLGGYVELDDNPIDFDNRRYFTLYVPEKEKVLIVEGERSTNLRILYGELGQFDAEFISERAISTVQLNDYRSLILVGLNNLSSGLADRLRTFVQEGGGIMFFPGENTNLNSFNDFFQSIGVGTFESARSLQQPVLASQVDLAHPVFEGIFAKSQSRQSFDAPNVSRYLPLKLGSGVIQNRIISLENGNPLLVESLVGNGRIYSFTLAPNDAWTDFHLKTIFAPLLFRISRIMNQSQYVQVSQEIGFYTPYSIRTDQRAIINLVGPDGQPNPPEQYAQGGATTLIFEQMGLQEGVYDITQEDEVLEKIAFNISDLESRLDFFPDNQLRETLNQKGLQGVQLLPPLPDSITTMVQQEKEGIPLWKYFIWLALLFLAVEVGILFLNNRKSKA